MVEILNKPVSLSSEKYVTLTCLSEGSRPAAQLTWFKDNRKIKRGKVNLLFDKTPKKDKKCIITGVFVKRCLKDFFKNGFTESL